MSDTSQVSLPGSERWWFDLNILHRNDAQIHIHAANNTSDIRGVLFDEINHRTLRTLTNEMKIFYNTEDCDPEIIQIGEYYALFDEEWQRVKCIDYNDDDETATIFFIDRGDTGVFPYNSLQELHSQFCQLPAQAVQFSLNGLEIFHDCEEIQSKIYDTLVEEDLNIQVKNYEKNADGSLTVMCDLFSVNDKGEVCCINDYLMNEMHNSILNPRVLIEEIKIPQLIYLCHASTEAVFIKIQSKGLWYYDQLMNEATEHLNKNFFGHEQVLEFDLNEMYVAKYSEDNTWYRVQIITIEDENRAKVLCIDAGHVLIVRRDELVVLKSISKSLSLYPAQAMQVMLYKVSPYNFDQDMVSRLHEVTSAADAIVMKAIDTTNDIPIVHLFSRAKDDSFIPINDYLLFEAPTKHLAEVAVFPLKAPVLSLDDNYPYIDVLVTSAANPHNLTIQLLPSVKKFKKMMEELLDACESFSGPHLTSKCIEEGNLYAAMNEEDDSWYRACLVRILTKKQFLVYACDYGDFTVVPLGNLQPLQKKFWDLPYQALKAKLDGVILDYKYKWSVRDSLVLNELIVLKKFIAVIKGQSTDENLVTNNILSIELIDTSGNEDIYVTAVLNGMLDKKSSQHSLKQ